MERSLFDEAVRLPIIHACSSGRATAKSRENVIPQGKEDIPWAKIALILIICRLGNPSSELHIAEHYYKSTALPELLGVPADKINPPRLYRALDKLLPHKEALEKHLKTGSARSSTSITICCCTT